MKAMTWTYRRNMKPFTVTWDAWDGKARTNDTSLKGEIDKLVSSRSMVPVAEVGVFREASLGDNLHAWGTISSAVRASADPGSVQAPPAFISGEDPDEDFVPTKAGKILAQEMKENRRSTGKNAR